MNIFMILSANSGSIKTDHLLFFAHIWVVFASVLRVVMIGVH